MPDRRLTLAARLAEARRQLFVGREQEKTLFAELLNPQSEMRVLYLHAAGGFGKTALLKELELAASEKQLPVVLLDTRSILATPDAVTDAIAAGREKLGLAADTPHLVFFDTFELLSALETWLREEWLPAQSDNVRVVIAGRLPPSLAWRSDPGWSQTLRHHQLPYLGEDEAKAYFERRELRPSAISQGVTFARGHPLALVLYADAAATGSAPLTINASSEQLLPELMASLLGNIESEVQRRALYACAIVRTLNEPLLAAMLELDGCASLFDWLRSQYFIDAGARGLFPHDLVRDILVADLKQRDPDLYIQLGECAYNWALERVQSGQGDTLEHALDAFFLLRDWSLPWQIAGPETEAPTYIDAVKPEDWPHIADMLSRFEGEESVKVLHALYKAQPDALRVVRDADQAVSGFFMLLALQELPAEVIAFDPITAAFWDHCRAGVGKNGRASLLRYWMQQDGYMEMSSILPLAFGHLYLHTAAPEQVYSGALHQDTEVWRGVAEMVGYQRLASSACEIQGRPVVVMYQDYSESSSLEWLRNIYRRIQGLEPVAPGRKQIEQVDRDVFEAEVQAALKHYLHPDRMHGNTLLDLLPASDRDDTQDKVQKLRELLAEQCAKLGETPKTEIHKRVLERTYLKPARDQQAAAEVLNLSFSTYRRRLKEAVRLLQAGLWSSLN